LSDRRDEDDNGEAIDGKPIVSGRDALPVLEHPNMRSMTFRRRYAAQFKG
jgi:hypothetical protein